MGVTTSHSGCKMGPECDDCPVTPVACSGHAHAHARVAELQGSPLPVACPQQAGLRCTITTTRKNAVVLPADKALRSYLLAPLLQLLWTYFPALPVPVSSEVGRATAGLLFNHLTVAVRKSGQPPVGLAAQEGSPGAAGML